MSISQIILMLLFTFGNPGNKLKTEDKTVIAPTSIILVQNEFKVIGITDGDTFTLLINGKPQVIRLAHVDCPEKKQPFGNKAKLFVSKICFGKMVTLIHKNEFDRNKRLITEVILLDGTNVNKELVKTGLAWHFKKYSKSKEYAALEKSARQKKVGLWADAKPTSPWEWRKINSKENKQQ